MNPRKRQQQVSSSASTSYPLDHPVTPPPIKLSRPLPPWPVSPAEGSQHNINSLPTLETPATWGHRSSPVCPCAPTKNRISRSRVFRHQDDENDDDHAAEPASIFRTGLRPRRLDFDDGMAEKHGSHVTSPLNSFSSDHGYLILHRGISSSPPPSPLVHDYNSSSTQNPSSPLVHHYNNTGIRNHSVSSHQPAARSPLDGINS